MLALLNPISNLLADENMEKRIRRLLLERRICSDVTDVTRGTKDQRARGIDLIVHLRDTDRKIYLQLRPTYWLANAAAKFTKNNVVMVVARKYTPEGLLQKKLLEGIAYFRG